jgi:hypothetical protein
MTIRLEKFIYDRLVNQAVLGKRKLGKPFKYVVDTPYDNSRYIKI